MKTINMYLGRFFESKTWVIIYLVVLVINIIATFINGFSWFNCLGAVFMIGVIFINPKEFFKPFKDKYYFIPFIPIIGMFLVYYFYFKGKNIWPNRWCYTLSAVFQGVSLSGLILIIIFC